VAELPNAELLALRDSFPSTRGAPVPSSTWAPVTTTAKSSPSVSTTMCRFRPLSRFPPSYPCPPPISVALTVWLSMLPALGVGSRPACRRTGWRKASLRAAQVPSFRHCWK